MSMLKALAQKAKVRLRAIQTEENEEIKEACLAVRMQYAIIANQKKVEADPLYNKVKKMLEKDLDTLSPLSKLIEHNSFDKMDDHQKEKYLFNLSKRYTQIKNHIASDLEKEVIF